MWAAIMAQDRVSRSLREVAATNWMMAEDYASGPARDDQMSYIYRAVSDAFKEAADRIDGRKSDDRRGKESPEAGDNS